MAGDVKTVDSDEALPTPDYQNPFPGILGELTRIREALTSEPGQDEIMQIVAGASPQSQHPRLRVRAITFSRATAGDTSLLVGTTRYIFTLPGFPVTVRFPIVIDRGADISCDGDGRLYLIGVTE